MIRVKLFHKAYGVLFCILVGIVRIHAQYAEKDFVRYTVKDGLSDNQITAIQQDNHGYLWVGTQFGLNRFDGSQFKQFHQGAPEHFQVSSIVRNLKSLSDDRLAIITRNGFLIMNTSTGLCQNYFISDSTAFGPMRNGIWDVAELRDGSFAVTTATGFYVINPDGSLAFRHDVYELQDVAHKRILYGRDMLTLTDNELFVYVEESEQAHYQTEQKIFARISHTDTKWHPFSHPPAYEGGHWVSKKQIGEHEYLFLSRNDSIVYYNHTRRQRVATALPFHWADEFTWQSNVQLLNDSTFVINGGYSGFYVYSLNRHSGRITCHPEKFLPNDKINCLFQDQDGRLWVGTSAGLRRHTITKPVINTYHLPFREEANYGFMDAHIHKGRVYVGRYARSAGLLVLDSSSMEPIGEITFYGKGSRWNEVFTLEMYHPDSLWLGTSLGLLWFDLNTQHYGKVLDPDSHPPEAYQLTILAPRHKDGNAWLLDFLQGSVARYHIASRTFTFFNSHSETPLPFHTVKSIAYDGYGDVWIGGHALARWNNRKQEFDTLISVYGGPNKFNDDILTLSADADGSLWLHNVENGLLEYRIRERQFVSYGLKEGLPSMSIMCLSPVYDHTLFIGSAHHLARFDTRTHDVETYGDEDDLPEHIFNARTMFIDTSAHMVYAFYKDDVIRFPLRNLPAPYSIRELLIHELIINNQTVLAFPKDGLRLNKDQNNLTLNYTVIDFEGGNNYQFAYRMHDSESWTSLGQQRSLNMTNLPPGEYSIEVSATSSAGEQRTTTISFSIAPPFWRTSWFILLSALAFAGIIYAVYRIRISQIRQRANLDKLLSQSEMNALHAQMNPHFVFNSLNSIREMILNNENSEASRYLSKFAHLIRVTLDQSHHPFISLRHTIDYLNRYIEMEKIRNAHFHFQMILDPALDPDETILPPMLIQPFIENAIWHGVNGADKGIHIRVAFSRRDEHMVCTIDDNGIGIHNALERKQTSAETDHQSLGISNIQHRIDLLNKKYHQQSSVTILDKSTPNGSHETGTIVTITLPLNIERE